MTSFFNGFFKSLQRKHAFLLRKMRDVNDYFVKRLPWLNNLIKPFKFKLASIMVSKGIRDKLASVILEKYSLLQDSQCSDPRSIVVIATFIHEYYRYLLCEASLALVSRKKGVKSYIYYNDNKNVFPIYLDEQDKLHLQYIWKVTDKIHNFLKSNQSGFYFPYSEIDLPSDSEIGEISRKMIVKDDFSFKGIDLRYHIDIGVVRYFRSCPKMTRFEKDYEDVLFRSVFSAVKAVLIAEHILLTRNPAAIFMSHSIYSYWGSMYKYFLSKNVKVVLVRSSSGGFRDGSIDFHIKNISMPDIASVLDISDDNSKYHGFIEKKVKDIMESRYNLSTPDMTDVSMITSDSSNEDKFLNKLRALKENNFKIFGMFPNLLYDYGYSTESGAFTHITDWITETIKYFENCNDKKLIFKLHPVESNPRHKPRANPISVINKLLDKSENDLKNVIVIHPKDNIVSYRLFPFLSGGVLYTGTLGLEMLYKNIPIVNGTLSAPYTGLGFTADVNNAEEYFSFFEDPSRALDFQMRNYRKLVNFIFVYMYVNQMPVSFLLRDSADPLADATLNRIVDFALDSDPHCYRKNIFDMSLRDIFP